MTTKEILLRGPEEVEQYMKAKQMAAEQGVPIGTVIASAMEALVRQKAADDRRAEIMQSQRDALRAKRRGM